MAAPAQINDLNPYEVLNLPPDADYQTIRERYYQYSKAFHPDKQPYELYEDSKRYFLLIEDAYKSIATPFSRFLYDRLGRVGTENYHKYSNLFKDLDEAYDFSITQMHELKASGLRDGQDYKRLKKETKRMEQLILKRYQFLLAKSNEEDLYVRVFKKISMKMEIELHEYFGDPHYWAWPQARTAKKNFSTGIHLPPFKEFQSDVIMYYDTNEEESKFGFIYKLHKRFMIPKLNQPINFKFSFNHPSAGPSIAWFYVDKEIPQLGVVGCSHTNNFELSNSDFFFNRNFNETSGGHCSVKFAAGRPVIINTGYHKKFVDKKTKLMINAEINPKQISIENELSKELTERISFVISAFSAQYSGNEYSISHVKFFGLKFKINKHTRLEFQNFLASSNHGVLLRLTRYHMNLEIPIGFASYPTRTGLLAQIFIFTILGAAAFFADRRKKNSSKKKNTLQKKNKNRLISARNHFDLVKTKYSNKASPIEQEERRKNGLIILHAAYGHPDKISGLYKKEKKLKTREVFLENEENSVNYDDSSEAAFTEIIDLTRYLQYFVTNSSLVFTLDKLEKSKGIFNPCLDEKKTPALFVRWLYNGKVHTQIFTKKGCTYKLGKLSETTSWSFLNYFV